MAANYDNSAWFYDRLSGLIFGKALVSSQLYLLEHIPAEATILIVGGGTGWILEEIAKLHPSGQKITYVEISAKMTSRSRQRKKGKNDVIFINDSIENFDAHNQFDIVITPFLLDNFTEQSLKKIFKKIHGQLLPEGLWLNIDFRLTGKWWQKVLLKSMLLFFRIICRIEATKLPSIEECFKKHRYKVICSKSFFGEFILSTAYQKPDEDLRIW